MPAPPDYRTTPAGELGWWRFVAQKHVLLGIFHVPATAALQAAQRTVFLIQTILFSLFLVGVWSLLAAEHSKLGDALQSDTAAILAQAIITSVIGAAYSMILQWLLSGSNVGDVDDRHACVRCILSCRAMVFRVLSLTSLVMTIGGVAFIVINIAKATKCKPGCIMAFILKVYSLSVLFGWVESLGVLTVQYWYRLRKERSAEAPGEDVSRDVKLETV